MPVVDLPAGLLRQSSRGAEWAAWLDRLPRLVVSVLDEWELAVDGVAAHGHCSLVVPVRSLGRPAVLKLALPDDESEHESLALQHWQGDGAVRLLRADPRRRTMLLERLHAHDLESLDDLSACAVVAGLYGRLHLPALPQLRPLTAYVERWTAALASLDRGAPVPRRLVEQAVSLAHALVADPESTGTTIHTDLHYGNVLAADRDPWLAIDPKPVSGDPHYEIAPLLWNRWEEAVVGGAVRDTLRRRFHTVVDTADLDEDRARAWVVVRALHNASWAVTDARAQHRDLSVEDRSWITRMVTVAKAVQD